MILEAKNLQKTYNKKILTGVDLHVNQGEVQVILGKNGAGKSTLLKIALGLVKPTDGEITVLGKVPGKKNNRIGYLSENLTIYPHLTAADNLRVAAYSTNQQLSKKHIKEILERVNLQEAGKKQSKSFSLGMKRRLQFAMAAMIKEMDLLILDEPTNGLDINGVIWLKKFINELRTSGVSILLASHAILEMQECVTSYAILDKGKIVRSGNWMQEQMNTEHMIIQVASDKLQETLKVLGDETNVSHDGKNKIKWKTNHNYTEVSKLLYQNGIFPEKIEQEYISLEKIYLETVEEEKK